MRLLLLPLLLRLELLPLGLELEWFWRVPALQLVALFAVPLFATLGTPL